MKKEWVAVTTASDDRISQKTVSQEPSKDGGNTGCIRVRYELKGLWKSKIEYGEQEYMSLGSNETGNTQEVEGLLVALPSNARFKELKVIDFRQKEISLERTIIPTPQSVREGK